jgi:hypothetical protein
MKTDRDRTLWLQKLLAARKHPMDRSMTTESRQTAGVRSGVRLLIGSAIVAVGSLTAAALAA